MKKTMILRLTAAIAAALIAAVNLVMLLRLHKNVEMEPEPETAGQ